MTYSDPIVTFSHPKMTYSYPNVTQCYPNVNYSGLNSLLPVGRYIDMAFANTLLDLHLAIS